MRSSPNLRLIPALALLAACGPSIVISRDPSLPINPHMTYAWGGGDPLPARTLRGGVDDDSVRHRVERAVDTELARRGFTKSPYGSAQLIVHYHIGLRSVVDTVPAANANCVSMPCDAKYDWGYWGEPGSGERIISYTEGRLILEFHLRPSMKVAWRGIEQGEATRNSATEPRINAAVAKLLASFPGKP